MKHAAIAVVKLTEAENKKNSLTPLSTHLGTFGHTGEIRLLSAISSRLPLVFL